MKMILQDAKSYRILTYSLIISFVVFPFISYSANFNVTNTNNSGAGSLRQAIINSNSSGTNDTITFAPSIAGQTITLTSSLPKIIKGNSSLDISNNNSNAITINGNSNYNIFVIKLKH